MPKDIEYQITDNAEEVLPQNSRNSDFRAKMPEWVNCTFAQINDKIFWLDEKGQILYVNRAMSDFLGLSIEALQGRYLADFDQSPQVSASHWQEFWTQLLDNQRFNYKTYFFTAAQVLIAVEASFQIIAWENTSLSLVQIKPLAKPAATNFDQQLWQVEDALVQQIQTYRQVLQDWKKAHQQLQAQCDTLYMTHSRSELANQALREGFWEIDLPDDLEVNENTPIWYSDQFCRLLGYEPEEFPPILKTWKDKIHPDQRSKVFKLYTSFIQGSSPDDIYNVEYKLQTKLGKYRWFNARAKLQRDKMGKPIREAGALLDINFQKNTERILVKKNIEIKNKHLKLLELSQELAEQKQKSDDLNNLKDRLLSIISHDFRSPLNSLQGMLNLLQGQMISEEELRELSAKILERVKLISVFLDNLLNWAKSQMEGSTVNRTRWNLTEIILNKIQLYQAQAEQKNIQLYYQFAQDCWVYADVNMIELVLRNLLSNALKFSPEQARIDLKTQIIVGNFVMVSVQDTGLGIAPDKINRLFGAENISTLGTHNEPGTGLGLLLCKDFVEKNGGSIWVESSKGQGSCFHFTIPSAE
ncbi:MAG: ATP-binding protein [Microscillaceae bacterium]|jgi:PAS domain S-box-containing protein|nr:ATP-binding protein [Microscillaceae bacterium]